MDVERNGSRVPACATQTSPGRSVSTRDAVLQPAVQAGDEEDQEHRTGRARHGHREPALLAEQIASGNGNHTASVAAASTPTHPG